MTIRFPLLLILAIPMLLASVVAQSNKEVSMHATGPFDVKTAPIDDKSLEPPLARFSLDKQYHGELEATGKGQMLAAGNPATGNAGYVAIEKVDGTLDGRTGSFALQHIGTIKDKVPHIEVGIVPGSGTGQLQGIAGTMTINFAAGGKHTYDLNYTLPSDK